MKAYLFSLLLLTMVCLIASSPKKNILAQHDIAKNYEEVPAGMVYLNDQKREVAHFFISKYEVSNAQYQLFLEDLKNEGKNEQYALAAPKVMKPASWKKTPIEEDAILPIYHTHEAFKHSPVMGISFSAAQLFCSWLTEQVNKEISDHKIEFKLPTKAQWIRAARGETLNKYAWESPYLRDAKGYFQCNFKRISAEAITFNAVTKAYEIVPPSKHNDDMLISKVNDFEPNGFGLHNMCGNVAEMTAEEGIAMGGSWNDTGYDVRVESISEYQEASPYVGFRPVMMIKE